MTIEHLGLRLYSTLPPVISEFVSNAYDAESSKVEITIPSGAIDLNSEVVIRDYGHGLDDQEIQDEFLPIGRPRRGLEGKVTMSKNGKVKVTGRKGLGKLSAFGVAEEIELLFIKSGQARCLRLVYSEMKAWSLDPANKGPYQPTVVESKSGTTSEKDGVKVTLRKLFRKNEISGDEIRKGLAKRLTFIGPHFKVLVNGQETQPGDRQKKSDCAEGFSWNVRDLPVSISPLTKAIKGWIGFLEKSQQTNRGVDIFANNKAAELGSFFNYASTNVQFARAHVVGEIHADFLDEEDDLISTSRNAVIWESAKGQALQSWGQEVLKWAFDKWVELRKEGKKTKIYSTKDFKSWLASRTSSEQKVAEKMVSILIDDDNIEAGSAEGLLDIIKSSVETKAFVELVDAIEVGGSSPASLLRLFDEWRLIEAREHLKLADGRLEVIGQLEYLMNKDALEVQEMQPLFESNPWIVDHKWHEVDAQATYTKLLREKCPEPKGLEEGERRLDILGITISGILTIVEIKRPKKTLSRSDLEQIEKYVDWARKHLVSSGEDSIVYVKGLLIVGTLNGELDAKVKRLAGDDIRVTTYRDMHHKSKEYYGLVEKNLARIAPEYSKAKRKKKS